VRETACHECGVIVNKPKLDREHQFYCPRCNATIYRPGQRMRYVVVMALSSIIFLIPALFLPLLSLNIAGIEQMTTLVGAIASFFDDGYDLLAFVVLITGIIAPLTMLLMVLLILIPTRMGMKVRNVAPIFIIYEYLLEWGMGEVYLVSIFVSMIKLQEMSMLVIGIGLYLFVGFLLTFFITILWFNPHDIWHKYELED